MLGSATAALQDAAEEVDIRRTDRPAGARPRETGQLLCYAAVGFVGLGAALVLLTLVLNVGIVGVGALNPAWQTFRALESRIPDASSADSDSDDEYHPLAIYRRNWAAYWVVAAGLFGVESLLVRPTIGGLIPGPLYPALIFALLVYLTNNHAEKSGAMYADIVRPALYRIERPVERGAKAIEGHFNQFVDLAVVGFHQFVEPYALQLRDAAVARIKDGPARQRKVR